MKSAFKVLALASACNGNILVTSILKIVFTICYEYANSGSIKEKEMQFWKLGFSPESVRLKPHFQNYYNTSFGGISVNVWSFAKGNSRALIKIEPSLSFSCSVLFSKRILKNNSWFWAFNCTLPLYITVYR